MKILHIINSLGSGGAEKLIEDLLPLMNNTDGVKVDLLLLTDKNNMFDKSLTKYGIQIEIVPTNKIYNLLNIYYIRKYIKIGQYDIVHVHLFPSFYWASFASKLIFKNKPKFVLTEHSTHNARREKGYFRIIEKFVYSSYDKIIAISHQAQNNLIEWLKTKNNNRFIIIENGIDLKKFKEAKPYLKCEINTKFDEDTKLICMVGRFSEAKDQPTLIKAMKYIPSNVHLLLVGEGPLKEKNEGLVRQMKLEDRVHFLGFREDVPRILKTVDIVVLSSNWEGLPLSAVEGMAAGKPLIGSNVPGINEVIDNYGILFSKGNSEELANKINQLINDPLKYSEIAKKCQLRANSYNIEKMVVEYIEQYKILLNDKNLKIHEH
ncbi:glycosyltransferase [Petrotoga sp. DB-2]